MHKLSRDLWPVVFFLEPEPEKELLHLWHEESDWYVEEDQLLCTHILNHASELVLTNNSHGPSRGVFVFDLQYSMSLSKVSTESRMRQKYLGNRIPTVHLRVTLTSAAVTSGYQFRLAMANVNFAQAVDYSLQRLCTPNLVLKPEQWVLTIEAIYNGRDVFVWLPTGFGKSICFQALPVVFDHKLHLHFIGCQFHLCAYFAIGVNSSICLNYVYAQATLMRSHAVV